MEIYFHVLPNMTREAIEKTQGFGYFQNPCRVCRKVCVNCHNPFYVKNQKLVIDQN